MNALVSVLSAPAWQHLALALLHTLWQGLLAVAILWLLLRRIPAARPDARYWFAFAALLGLLVSGLVTWSVLDFEWPAAAVSHKSASEHVAQPPSAVKSEARSAAQIDGHSRGRLCYSAGAEGQAQPMGWASYLLAAWFLGVVLMLLRMLCMVVRLRRFARGPEIADGRLRLWIDELCAALRLKRSVRIVETVEAFGPAMLGIIRPVLVLPVAMMTGLPPDAVRAILAHELAHVRRQDYLWNLVQMVVEAVLFFNPAVWWISRQIRIEREACCDALAARLVGEPLLLAQALSLWAERAVGQVALAAAFAGPERRGPRLLLDRIQRMVLPGYRPQMPVSPLGLLGVLLLALLALGGSWRGTSALLNFAAKILTPAERMERIVETQHQYALPEVVSPQGKTTLSGTIRTRGGEAVPKVITDTVVRSGQATMYVYNGVQSPDFSITEQAGTTWLRFASEGYAPAIVGPFNGKAGETISGIEVVLERGFPLTVRVVDENGKPTEGASLRDYPVIGDGSIGLIDHEGTTDAKGVAIIPHVVQRRYDFSVRKSGFQPVSMKKVAVNRDYPLTLTLVHARLLRGVVLSHGQPVVGAEIHQYAKFTLAGGINVGEMQGQGGPAIATTDAQGQFVLDELEDEATYAMLIVTKEHGRHLVQDVTSKKKDLRIEIGPELIVSGIIHGDLNKLTKENGKPVIVYGQSVSLLPYHHENCQGGKAPVQAIDGGGTFVLRGLLPSEVTITAGEHVIRTTVGPSQPRQQVTIDLTKPASKPLKRQIVIRFATPDGTVPPEGAIQVAALRNAEEDAAYIQIIPLKKGEARFDAYAPGPLSYEPQGLLGYWFEAVHMPRIEPGKEPLEISVPVIPAGAIAGQVLNVDGTPASENISILVDGEFVRPQSTRHGSFGQSNINADANGKFFISPLPLGGTFTVTAQRGHTVQLSAPLRPDAAHPTVKLTLRLPPTTAVEGEVLDPDGRPLARFAFGLGFSPPKGRGDSSWGGDLATDGEGRFRIADVSVGVGDYSLTCNPRRDFRPLRVPLPLDGRPLTVQLQRGLVLEGQVLDGDTERPLPGAEVYAMPAGFRPGDVRYDAESRTDGQGRFRFSNLDDRSYRIFGTFIVRDNDATWTPGGKPIVLRVTPSKKSAR